MHFYPHEHRFLLADQYFVLKMKMLHMVPLLLVVAVLARSGCHNKTPETTDGWLKQQTLSSFSHRPEMKVPVCQFPVKILLPV